VTAWGGIAYLILGLGQSANKGVIMAFAQTASNT